MEKALCRNCGAKFGQDFTNERCPICKDLLMSNIKKPAHASFLSVEITREKTRSIKDEAKLMLQLIKKVEYLKEYKWRLETAIRKRNQSIKKLDFEILEKQKRLHKAKMKYWDYAKDK